MTKFDIAVIGGGPGGYVAAIRAAQQGASVVVFEEDKPGGLCLNWGCIPTKTLLVAAKRYKQIKEAPDFGINGLDISSLSIDWKKTTQRKDTVVGKLSSGVEMLFKKNKITFIKEHAEVVEGGLIKANEETYQYEHLIIATGAKTKYPQIKGLDIALDKCVAIDHKGFLKLEELPKSAVVVGGGIYGVEIASLLNALDVETTLIHMDKAVLPWMDKELSQALERQLKKSKVKIINEAAIEEIDENTARYSRKDENNEISADLFIFLSGTEPKLKGLDKLSIELDENGFIKTDEFMKTSVDKVYAVGDVNGKFPLAHVAYKEGIVAVENILGNRTKMDYKELPTVVYGFPELASVGLTEEEAITAGYDVNSSKFNLIANGMAIAKNETAGFVKVISDKKYGEVLGVHIAAADASEMIGEALGFIKLEATIEEIASTMHPHPSMSEAIFEASLEKPIHS